MKKAWFIGVSIILVANITWFLALQKKEYSEILFAILWGSPLVAAFIVAYLSPFKKMANSLSMSIPMAIIAVVFNGVYQLLGNTVDFPGIQGGLILFGTTLLYSLILCGLGGFLGYVSARK